MNPQDHTQPDHKQRVSSDLRVMQPGEVVIAEVKRHPIGLISIYMMMVFILLLVAVIGLVVLPNMAGGSGHSAQVKSVAAIIIVVMATLAAVYAFIATKVYWGNRWIITSDSVTQVSQTSLFDRQSSQLSLENIEDITSEQNGILTHVFNYGVLKAETAGEQSKFAFTYCPNPNYYAKRILEAREAHAMQMHHINNGSGESQQVAYQPAPDNFQPPQPAPQPPVQQEQQQPAPAAPQPPVFPIAQAPFQPRPAVEQQPQPPAQPQDPQSGSTINY